VNCRDVEQQLTAYLDGELADDRGSSIRGHLRSCEACRRIAADEGALRDGLRQLPPVDAPSTLWANVQAQLANAEVADAKKPAWKRAVGRWAARLAPAWPQLAFGGVAAAAIVTFVVWRSHGSEPVEAPDKPLPVATMPAPVAPPAVPDVTDDLAAEPAQVTDSYADAAEELLALANEERARWTADERQTFDENVGALRGTIENALEGRPKQKAWRALIRYLQSAAIRDEVALASGGAP
jgi:hypothetical protein